MTNYKTLTERCEQLRAFLRELVLQRDVALLLCGAVERRQLSHVTAQQRVQQRHQLLAQHGAQLHVCVRIHRAQDQLVLPRDDGPDSTRSSWGWEEETMTLKLMENCSCVYTRDATIHSLIFFYKKMRLKTLYSKWEGVLLLGYCCMILCESEKTK